MEPTSTAAGGYAITKTILLGIAGLFGATSASFFHKDEKLRSYGRMAAGAIIGGVGVGVAITLGGLLIQQFGLDGSSPDVALGIGFLSGVTAVGFVSMVSRFFEKREGKDILEVVREVRGTTAPAKPVRKTVARKSPAKKATTKVVTK